jgi:hypothetical protein
MPGFAGLRTDLNTWLLLAGVTACWVLSLRLVPGWKSEGWPSVLKSLYGFVWLGFGLDILLRFSMLAYNAVEWGNGTLRLITQPVDTVNRTLVYCWLFWVLLSLGYAVAVRRRGVGPLSVIRQFNVDLAYAAVLPTTLLCSVLFYLTDRPKIIPLEFITPLASLGYLYVVPATIVWWAHFRQPSAKRRIGSVHILALLPALVHGLGSPYRENLAPILLIPLIAAIFAGERPALRKLLPAVLVWFVVVSSLVSSYRLVKWENARTEEVENEIKGSSTWEKLAGTWGDRMKRFHSFDSMLLTVELVPAARPHSGRDMLLRPFIRAFVPRFIFADKGEADAGERFGAAIWAFDDRMARDHSGAAIAPSMPGDLYEAGGLLDIIFGALIWGALLGLVDGWKRHLPSFSAAAITVLVATHCAMSIERDFDHSVAAFIQILLLLVIVAGVIALVRRPDTNYSFGFRPGLERS